MADGSIVISTRLDNSGARQGLAQLEKALRATQKQAEKQAAKVAELEAKYAEVTAPIREINEAAGGGPMDESALFAAVPEAAKINAELITARDNLAELRGEEARLNDQLETTRRTVDDLHDTAPPTAEEAAESVNRVAQALERFEHRVIGLAKRVFVFTLITKALRGVREYLGNAIKVSDEATAALSRLKGALLTAAQPIINILIPAFTTLANVLTRVVSAVASVISALFGKTLEQSASAAQGLYNEQKALKGVGSAAKSASKSLAAFDEINQLGDDSGGTAGGGAGSIAPSFDFSASDGIFSKIKDRLSQIGDDIREIFLGLKDFIVGIFTGDWDQALDGIGNFLDGARKLIVDLFGFLDEIVGGTIDKIIEKFGLMGTPLGEVLAGIKLAFHGLSEFVSGVFTGDLDKAIKGVQDIFEGLKLFVFGIIDGIEEHLNSFLDWLDEKTGGKLSPIIEFIKQRVNDVAEKVKSKIDFAMTWIEDHIGSSIRLISDLISGDWDSLWKDFVSIAVRYLNVTIARLESFLNRLPNFINGVLGLINDVVAGLNRLPGNSFSPIRLRVPTVTLPRIPALAEGAVIPANREFLAVLGDQTSGRNIEAPEALLRQMAQEAASANTELLQAILAAIREGHVIEVDHVKLGKTARKAIRDVERMGL
ncbi:MAG: hypothetical protein IKN81_10435 [Oscillospiraceae bacterium]|nr:hypothetical protein [Oscillospiraceae bacterium]